MWREAWGLAQDLGAWVALARRVAGYGPAAEGTDFTGEAYRDQVGRAVRALHPTRMELELVATLDESADTRTFRFTRVDGALPPFRAGQYVNVYVTIGPVRTSRPYSISSAPGEPHLDLTLRRKPGGFVTRHLFEDLKVGDRLTTSGPAGAFGIDPVIDGESVVFLAGGSGITPFMAMLRDAARRGFERRLQLLYGVRSPDDVPFRAELDALAEREPRFSWTLVVSDAPRGYRGTTGLLDADRIRKSVRHLPNKRFLACGPNAMLALVEDALEELGVPPHRLRRELFGPPDDPTAEPGWPADVPATKRVSVELDEGPRVSAVAGESLLTALERAGVLVPVQCRAGECSACRTRLLEGEVFLPSTAAVRESDLESSYIHACVAYPLTNLRIRIHPGQGTY